MGTLMIDTFSGPIKVGELSTVVQEYYHESMCPVFIGVERIEKC